MNELHLFSGAGGGILGGMLLGHTCVCAVEIEPYRRKVLLQRQRDGILPKFPIWDNVETFDGRPWRGIVDVVAGGFPCQDISGAFHRNSEVGIIGERSKLWNEMARIICEVQPAFVFVENSPMLVGRGLGLVLRDMARLGYDAEWGVFSACSVGAPHMRKRLFVLGHSSKKRRMEKIQNECPELSERKSKPRTPWETFRPVSVDGHGDKVWCVPDTDAVGGIDGLADWVDRLDASGDGQVPSVVALAWNTLSGK